MVIARQFAKSHGTMSAQLGATTERTILPRPFRFSIVPQYA